MVYRKQPEFLLLDSLRDTLSTLPPFIDGLEGWKKTILYPKVHFRHNFELVSDQTVTVRCRIARELRNFYKIVYTISVILSRSIQSQIAWPPLTKKGKKKKVHLAKYE